MEWPPSPWRILRAFISTWYHKANGEIAEGTVRNLIVKLSALPRFHLPSVTLSHTRHYMPLYDRKTAKIFDTFARIESDKALYIAWPDVVLTGDERRALDVLLSRLGYFGRAESWIEARLVDGSDAAYNSIPLEDGGILLPEHESIRTLACRLPEDYLQWRENTVAEHKERGIAELRLRARERGRPEDKVTLGKKDLEVIEAGLPTDIFLALHTDTGDLKRVGWSQPPGSRWVTYTRPKNAFDVKSSGRAGKATGDAEMPTVARFAVISQATPRLIDSVSLAERIHIALVSRSDGSSVFTGCDDSGKPSQGHRHAYILCESNLSLGKGRRGEITHVTVYAPAGFGRKERIALDGLTKVWGHGGHDVQLILLGVGRPENFAGVDIAKGACPLVSESSVWVSRTPFVPTRHAKATRKGKPKLDENELQIGSPVHDLYRLLELGGFPRPKEVEPVSFTNLGGHVTRWLEFMRERRDGNGKKSTNMGYGFRIEFRKPVRGPIAIGYGAHFGLGLFVPA